MYVSLKTRNRLKSRTSDGVWVSEGEVAGLGFRVQGLGL